MKVSELIELLKTMPQDMNVTMCPVDFVECDIEDVGVWDGRVFISDEKPRERVNDIANED